MYTQMKAIKKCTKALHELNELKDLDELMRFKCFTTRQSYYYNSWTLLNLALGFKWKRL